MENTSFFDREKIIAEYYRDYRPAVIMLGVFCVMGVVGNSVVIIVYWKIPKMTMTTTQFLIFVMAIFDFLTALIAIPLKMVHRMFWFEIVNVQYCKLMRSVTMTLIIPSGLLMSVVTFIRYCHVCKPHWLPLVEPKIKVLSVLSVVIGVVNSLLEASTAALFELLDFDGRKLPELECTFKRSYFSINIVRGLKKAVNIFVVLSLTIMNILIIINVCKKRQAKKVSVKPTESCNDTNIIESKKQSLKVYSNIEEQSVAPSEMQKDSVCHFPDSENKVQTPKQSGPETLKKSKKKKSNETHKSGDDYESSKVERHITGNETLSISTNSTVKSTLDNNIFSNNDSPDVLQSNPESFNQVDAIPRIPSKVDKSAIITINTPANDPFKPLNRTSIMLFLVSFIYVLCYLPFFIIATFIKIGSGNVHPEVYILMKYLIRPIRSFYFMGCCVNPIIYAFVNPDFRDMCRSLFKRS